MAARRVFGTSIQQGETFRYTVTFSDEDGAPIDLTDATFVTSLVFTWYDKNDTEVVVRASQDVLGTPSMDVYPGDNEHTIGDDGVLTWDALTTDTSFSQTANTTMIGQYVLTYDTDDRVLVHEFQAQILAVTALT